jgi:hypothetical protein
MENLMSSKQLYGGETAARATSQARVHRTVTAVGLAGSAALVAIGGVIAPPSSGRPDELYRIATEASGRLMAEAQPPCCHPEDRSWDELSSLR